MKNKVLFLLVVLVITVIGYNYGLSNEIVAEISDFLVDDPIFEDWLKNSYFVSENDWEGMTYKISILIDGEEHRRNVSLREYFDISEFSFIVSTTQECFFPKATLAQVYKIVNKPNMAMQYLRDELPPSNARFTHLDGLQFVTYEYKAKNNLYIEYIWEESGGGFSLEIIEEDNGTKSVFRMFVP
ncbi:MAG: hypothetical protein FWG98_03475 [Candidatus Cloacimonetes bacterium]|nr:hypothetical protein [Candidatus Cloacimonadota bacterium]